MEAVGGFLVLVSVVAGSVSFVGLFLRLPSLWLPTRARAIRVWVASFVLLLIGGSLLPDPPSQPFEEPVVQEPLEAQEAPPRDSAPGAADGAPANNVTTAPSGSPASGNLTAAQRNAVRSANSYLQLSGFSRQGLIDQLSSEFGDSYSVGDATVAVNSLSTDWNAQAARSAVSYLALSGFSCQGLIDQLSSEFGDKYTVEQATYGATQAGIC